MLWHNVTLFVFSELEEMLISYVIIDMDSGHGNEFLIIPNINERKKLASSRRQKKVAQQVWKSHCDNHPNDSMKMSWIRTRVEMVRTKLVEHFYPFPRPDGNPCIQELELEMFEGKKYFFIIIFLLWAGILEF